MTNIALFVATPILLVVALAVRFAGKSKPLNTVDYSGVSDPDALHAWAGNRLLLLALLSAALTVASIIYPEKSGWFIAAFLLSIFGIAFWIAGGSGRFIVLPSLQNKRE